MPQNMVGPLEMLSLTDLKSPWIELDIALDGATLIHDDVILLN